LQRTLDELTGMDLTDPKDSRMLAAAQTIHRLFPAAES
jgi:hypothetical protein